MERAPVVVIPDAPHEAEREALRRALIAYNDATAGPTDYRPLAVLLKDDVTEAVIGGLWGRTAYAWLFVELFVVPQSARRHGFGSRLLADAERLARARGCVGVWLDTFAFQAPGFYLRHGYMEFGRIDDFPAGSARHFFMKRLDTGDA